MQHDRPLPLTVVIASNHPWPEVEACLASLAAQARAVGAEIILADGCGRALPDCSDRPYPEVIWLKALGASAFGLRALAIAQARGDIIAITENHCHVHPDWCARIIKAHADNPSAVAIGGAIENGATQHLVDWAGYFIANGTFMLPIRNGESERISLQANISYKRRALVRRMSPDLGLMEMLHNQALREQGEKLVADDQIVVDHIQCLSFPTYCALHFHNGRSIAGFRLQRMRATERFLRLGGCFILPPVMLSRLLRTVFAKRRFRDRAVLSLPLLACLLCCHAAGEFLGYIAGPGNSPRYPHIG
jgi:hypothetical protein